MSASIDFPYQAPLPLPPASSVELLRQAREGVREAARTDHAAEKFATAYLAALRGAAAVLASRGRPHRGRAKPTSAWVLLASLAPELKEWAAFFASASSTRAAVLAGITSRVTPRAADDLVRQADLFLRIVDRTMHEARQ